MTHRHLFISLVTAILLAGGCSFDQTNKRDDDTCSALWADAESKKGRPLQHSAAVDRYRTACTGY